MKTIKNATAVKVRNMVANSYNGRKIKKPPWGSNPYSDKQVLEIEVPVEKARELVDDLEESEWQRSKDCGLVEPYRHFKLGDNSIYVSKKHPLVRVVGTKKAKRMTVPYYD